jgi:hypothetical protein
MDQIEILILIGVILLGLNGWLHYIINKQQLEIKALWLQVAVLAAATAKQFTKIQEEQDNGKQK